jgi:two-component system, NarL family, response regulator DegU
MTKERTHMEASKIKILLVDDQESVLVGLKMLLELENDLEVIAEARDGKTAIQLVGEYQPDVVVMDYELPHMDGITATRVIQAKFPELPVIMLSIHGNTMLRAAAQTAGVATYLEKRAGASPLIQEIRRLMRR